MAPRSGAGRAAGVEAAVLIPSEEVEELVTGVVGSSALFASRFRENAARALLLPRRRPGQRTPLWQMRQRASQLLAVASRYGSFPIILETYREVLRDVFDLAALRDILAGIERREIRRRERGDAAGVALRGFAALRLHRRLHVRGRCAAGRPAGAGAGP